MFGATPKKTTQSKIDSPKANTAQKDIPYVKPRQSKEEAFKLPEVQKAMEASKAFVENKGNKNAFS